MEHDQARKTETPTRSTEGTSVHCPPWDDRTENWNRLKWMRRSRVTICWNLLFPRSRRHYVRDTNRPMNIPPNYSPHVFISVNIYSICSWIFSKQSGQAINKPQRNRHCRCV